MRIALIARSTLYRIPGGDSVHVTETARHLQQLGAMADVCTADTRIPYDAYDIFHFFNLIRPADILYHMRHIKKPFVLTPILVDYSEYDKQYRRGLSGFLFSLFSADQNEYFKTVARWITGRDGLRSKNYLWKGQFSSMKEIMNRAAAILPGSALEEEKLRHLFPGPDTYKVVCNGINPHLFARHTGTVKDPQMVLCAARIEGIKNQLHLIRALNDTDFTLYIVGNPAPSQENYFNQCKKEAASNVKFIPHLPQEELKNLYAKANVHVLPSWFETCGLSSLEAAASGASVVITDRGYAKAYFGEAAVYCNPADPDSIRSAVEKAAAQPASSGLQEKIMTQFTWERAAAATLDVYQTILQ